MYIRYKSNKLDSSDDDCTVGSLYWTFMEGDRRVFRDDKKDIRDVTAHVVEFLDSQDETFTVMPDEVTEEGGDRFNTGKSQLSYILDAPVAMKGLSEVFSMGAEKYSRDNWKKGLKKDEIIDSLLRHLIAYKSGELVDPESGKCHTHHVHWNALVLAEQHSN